MKSQIHLRHRVRREILMRLLVICALIVAIYAFTLGSTQAAPPDLSRWFLDATAWNAPGTSTAIATPDFLGGKRQIGNDSVQSLCDFNYGQAHASLYALWNLMAYDRKHQIGVATLHDDSNGCALFEAPTPAVTVPDADFSQSSTGRGLRIGSPYARVLSIYGPPEKHGRHFVTSYSSTVPGKARYIPYKPVKLPERITIVIDNGRVSSILIFIDEAGLY